MAESDGWRQIKVNHVALITNIGISYCKYEHLISVKSNYTYQDAILLNCQAGAFRVCATNILFTFIALVIMFSMSKHNSVSYHFQERPNIFRPRKSLLEQQSAVAAQSEHPSSADSLATKVNILIVFTFEQTEFSL